MIETPIAIVNFKAYSKAIGENAVKLAGQIEKAAEETGKPAAICVAAIDLARVAEAVDIPVFVQHCDPFEPGAHTGKNLLESAKDWGADGVLINHAEDQVPLASIDFLIERAKEFGLLTFVCSNDVKTTQAVASMNPDMVAVEPPELIGSGISVTEAEPDVVEDAVKAVREFDKQEPKAKVLCGAGIKSGEDTSAAVKLGADGVFLASFITKADNPAEAMKEILEGL